MHLIHSIASTNLLCTLSCSDFDKINGGIGSNLSILIQWGATFLASLAVGFLKNWLLTIVLIVAMPLVVVPSSIFNKVNECMSLLVGLGCNCSDSCLVSYMGLWYKYRFAHFSYTAPTVGRMSSALGSSLCRNLVHEFSPPL